MLDVLIKCDAYYPSDQRHKCVLIDGLKQVELCLFSCVKNGLWLFLHTTVYKLLLQIYISSAESLDAFGIFMGIEKHRSHPLDSFVTSQVSTASYYRKDKSIRRPFGSKAPTPYV